MLRDMDIRNALIVKIEEENRRTNFKLLEEFQICDGFSRADVAVANGKFIGYEIKSDADKLVRLSTQISSYDKTFDYVNIVVGRKLFKNVKEIIPDHWGIVLVENNQHNSVVFKLERSASFNMNVDKRALLDLLWREELVRFLSVHGFGSLSKLSKRRLRDLIEKNFELDLIKEYTRESIKLR